MIGRFLAKNMKVNLNQAKYAIALTLVSIPLIGQTAPSEFGTFTLNTKAGNENLASGSYTTKNGAEGTFTIKRKDASVGYNGEKFKGGANGIEIENDAKQGAIRDAKDEFSYTFTIAPTNPNTIHTIKIGQATYDKIGNSEIARQTLSYTDFTPLRLGTTASATIRENPSVSYFYDAMGDYFMGKKLNETNLQGNIAKSEPQLRINDSASNPLYYYNITNLNGTGNTASYTPTRTDDTLKEVTLRTANGILPSTATFANILKSSAQPNTYRALRQGDVLGNNSTYVSYGIRNEDSNYVIDVRNAQSVTLKYEGIMNGNFAVNAPVVGETFKEWITFGVESELAPNVIPAPPNANIVQCDAGYIYDAFSTTDYSNLATLGTSATHNASQQVIGLKNESYIIASNSFPDPSGPLTSGGKNTYTSKLLNGNKQGFELFQDFSTKSSTRTVNYKFKNSFTNEAQPLHNFSFSIFDIDQAKDTSVDQSRFEFSDYFKVTGKTALGAPVSPSWTYKAVGIKEITGGYTPTNTAPSSSLSCSNDLDGKCQVSLTFKDPVTEISITYGNNTELNYSFNKKANDPGDQLINIIFDGYCYKPQPRITYSKELADPRKTDTDQFVVQIKDNSSVVTGGIASITTAGEGNIVSDATGTTGIFKVDPTKTYTLTEGIAGTTTLLNYKPSYECKNSDGIVVTNNPSVKLNYGDAWRCIITNSTPEYVISGIVFDDKGKVTDPSSDDVSAKYISDSDYFNGKFNPLVESGIKFTSGHTITLDKCSGGSAFIPQTVNISGSESDKGTYSFTVTPKQIGNNTKLCVTQTEPRNYGYSVDTTSNTQQIDIVDKYIYPNNDFGDVRQANAALVLVKSQYIHDCSLESLTTIRVNYDDLPIDAYSTKMPVANVNPGQCIAYRIEAINRGNVPLTDIIIRDPLQKSGEKGALITSTLINPAPVSENGNTLTFQSLLEPIGNNREVITNGFSLRVTNPKDRKAIRFNTKYGNIIDP